MNIRKWDKKRLNALMESDGRYEMRAEATVTHFYIYTEIGFWGVQANDIVRDIDMVTTAEIIVHVNSPGGDVWDGWAIYNALKRSKADVTVMIEGIAASIASIIALGGDRVLINRAAQVMIHDPWTFAYGNAAELRQTADILEKTGGQLAEIYAGKMGITVDEAKALMSADTWYTGQEAVDAKFADALIEETDPKTDPAPNDAPAARKTKTMMAMLVRMAEAQRPARP